MDDAMSLLQTQQDVCHTSILHTSGALPFVGREEEVHLNAETLLEGLEQAIPQILERLPSANRRLVGFAALLGVEVSLYEVARLAEVAPSVTAEALAHATGLGILVERSGNRVSFVHERVRAAALALLGSSERLAAHARAATLLTGSTSERVWRRVHHAFLAASRSSEDAASAVQVAREAATALQATDGFEQAAEL